MQPRRGFDGKLFEAVPEGILPIDIVHRAVRRLYEDEGDEPPVAPSVRVINLSVCDRSRPFDRGMSSWARLLDWLSWTYNVLFVISAGNHSHDIELSVPREDLRNLSPEDREKVVIKAIAADTRHRRLLSPAETLNGLTIAATHSLKGRDTVGSSSLTFSFRVAGSFSLKNWEMPIPMPYCRPRFLTVPLDNASPRPERRAN